MKQFKSKSLLPIQFILICLFVPFSFLSQAPDNDNCSSSLNLVSGAAPTCAQTTNNGTKQTGEVTAAASTGASNAFSQTVWYSFTATSANMYVEWEMTGLVSGASWCPGRLSIVVYNTSTCIPTASNIIIYESAASDGAIVLDLTGLTIGSTYLIQVGYNDGSGCKIPIFCIGVGNQPTQCSCTDPCASGCGFATAPTVAQVTSSCPEYVLTPLADGGSINTYCYDFVASNSTVSFSMIITSNCGSGGNVTGLTWTLQSSSCGAVVASGNLTSMQATGLTVGTQYVLCYNYTVPTFPTPCFHSSVYPYFVGATSCPTASLSYAGPFCKSITTAQNPTLSGTGTYTGGAYSSSPSGLSINSSTGAVTPSTSTAGTYTVTYTIPASGSCPSSTATATVVINAPPTAGITPPASMVLTCTTTSLSATATGGGTYSWSGGSTPTTAANTFSTAGTYTVTVTGSNGCTATSSIIINSNVSLPTIDNVSIIHPLCNQNTGIIEVFTTLSSGNATYTITGLNPIVAVQSNATGSFANISPGNYEITVTENGCISAPSMVTVNTPPAPPTILVTNPTICAGEQVNLSVTANPAGGTFSWSTGQTTQTISVNPIITTAYQVSYALNGCSAITTSLVTVYPTPTVMVLDQNVCSGETANIVALPSSPGGTYLWLPNGETTQSISVTNISTSIYTVIYTLNQCTSLPVNTTVTVNQAPEAGFILNPESFNDYSQIISFPNTTTNANSYYWDFGDGFTSDIEEPTHYFQNISDEGILVTLIAYNSYGCQDTFSLVINREEKLIYYVPNSFTPDASGINEVFQPIFTEGLDPYNFSMLIFNRWGEIVFESHDVTIGWDGTYGTGPNIFKCQEGVYTWQIEFKKLKNDENIRLAGHVTLIK